METLQHEWSVEWENACADAEPSIEELAQASLEAENCEVM
jgi:hypothetical protein